ncbi:MAG: helix-turn-helix domain-containing protein [Desulfobulbaceae bacterium]|jgi:DNA-binding XRE family transcriptional regulator|nr:helix-turn-helix domain-containing protein [Desulfobulbaceae bacterium]
MLAVVKTPHTELRVEGDIAPAILTALTKEYGDAMRVYRDDEAIPVEEMAWYQEARARLTPARMLRIRRDNAGLTQQQLVRTVGVSAQNISAMERGRRTIGRAMARKLAQALDADADDFFSAV